MISQRLNITDPLNHRSSIMPMECDDFFNIWGDPQGVELAKPTQHTLPIMELDTFRNPAGATDAADVFVTDEMETSHLSTSGGVTSLCVSSWFTSYSRYGKRPGFLSTICFADRNNRKNTNALIRARDALRSAHALQFGEHDILALPYKEKG
jgi:hypothetical protein